MPDNPLIHQGTLSHGTGIDALEWFPFVRSQVMWLCWSNVGCATWLHGNEMSWIFFPHYWSCEQTICHSCDFARQLARNWSIKSRLRQNDIYFADISKCKCIFLINILIVFKLDCVKTTLVCVYRAEFRLAPSQWKTVLPSNNGLSLAGHKPRMSPGIYLVIRCYI